MEQFNYFQFIARHFDAEQKRQQKEIAYRERQKKYKQNLSMEVECEIMGL